MCPNVVSSRSVWCWERLMVEQINYSISHRPFRCQLSQLSQLALPSMRMHYYALVASAERMDDARSVDGSIIGWMYGWMDAGMNKIIDLYGYEYCMNDGWIDKWCDMDDVRMEVWLTKIRWNE